MPIASMPVKIPAHASGLDGTRVSYRICSDHYGLHWVCACSDWIQSDFFNLIRTCTNPMQTIVIRINPIRNPRWDCNHLWEFQYKECSAGLWGLPPPNLSRSGNGRWVSQKSLGWHRLIQDRVSYGGLFGWNWSASNARVIHCSN